MTKLRKKKLVSAVNLHLMGEPTLHPKLIDILQYGASRNIKTVLTTNGSTLVEKIVPKILESLYGEIVVSHMTATKESYHLRGKVGLSWDRYIDNIRLVVREYMIRQSNNELIKNNIVIRVMVTQNTASNASVIESESEAQEILKEWSDYVREIEQELGLVRFNRIAHNQQNLLKDNNASFTNYSLQNGITLQFWKAFTFANTCVDESYHLEEAVDTAYCPHPFTDIGVLWNGDVTLCSLDHDGHLKVGNMNEFSIEQLIQGQNARKLRSSMLGRRPLPEICKTCQSKPVKI
ncbi:SPASM domain-containing protein [Planktomarina temperata]|nr:SPASM domain-containing protein [Planktomarina temperata]